MMERARRIALVAAVSAAVGLGGAQVLAQPGPTCDGKGPCTDSTCARICSALGFRGGFCNTGGGCSCYL
ncbi:MAG TPA: hypothetical protein VM890_12430 [Longimicrobium sp.]|jgi:hypothetical protein|nr:hypothetical protein [Longimicrobium sp.]